MTGAEDETTADAAPGAGAPPEAPAPTPTAAAGAGAGETRAEAEEMVHPEGGFGAIAPPDRTSPPVGANPRAAVAPPLRAAVEPPSPDVAPVAAESGIPGMHRGGFERWPTAPIGVVPTVSAPDLDAPLQWAPAEPAAPSRGMSGWALGFAITALVVAMFVGWGFLIALVAIVTAIVALRRPLESRAAAIWALVLGGVSLLYSAGWLIFAATRTDLLG